MTGSKTLEVRSHLTCQRGAVQSVEWKILAPAFDPYYHTAGEHTAQLGDETHTRK